MADSDGIEWLDPATPQSTTDVRSPAFDPRSALQKRKASGQIDADGVEWHEPPPPAQAAPQTEGFWKSFGAQSRDMSQGMHDMYDFRGSLPQMKAGKMDFSSQAQAPPMRPPFAENADMFEQAGEAIGEGKPFTAARKFTESAIPVLGPMMDKAGNQAEAGNLAGAAGSTAENLLLMGGPEAAAGATEAAIPAVGRGLQKTGRAAYDSAMPATPLRKGQSAAETAARRQQNIDYGLRKGLDFSEAGNQRADALLDQTGKSIGDVTRGNTDTAPLGPLVHSTRDVEAGLLKVDQPAAAKVREELLNEFRTEGAPGGVGAVRDPTWEELQQLKTRYGNRAWEPGQAAAVEKQTRKAVERTAHDYLVQQFPELKDLYKDYSEGLDYQKDTKSTGKGKTPGGALIKGLKNAVASAAGGTAGLFLGGPAGAAAGSTLGGIAADVLSRPSVKSKIAQALYRKGSEMSMDTAMSTVTQRLAGMSENPIGLSIKTLDLPERATTPDHVKVMMAQAITDSPDKTLAGVTNYAAKNFGERWNVATRAGKETVLDPKQVYKDAKVWLKNNPDITPTAEYQGKTDAGAAALPKDFDWYRQGIKEYAGEHGVPDANMKKFVNLAAALSPQVSVDTALDMAAGAYKLYNAGASDSEIMKAMHSTTGATKNRAMVILHADALPTGRKVGPFGATTNVLFGGEQPDMSVVDRHSGAASGFGEDFNDSQHRFMDARQRSEAMRLGVDRVDKAQAANWFGQRGLDDLRPYIDNIKQAVEKHGGPDEVFGKATSFDTAAFDSTPPVVLDGRPGTFAFKMSNGRLLSDPAAESHLDLMERHGVNPEKVRDSGWIDEDGQYISGDGENGFALQFPRGTKAPERGPNEAVTRVADAYNAQNGLRPNKPVAPTKIDIDRARAIARAYDALPAHDARAKPAYDALKKEVGQQWDAIQHAGYTLEPWTQPGQPYANSAEMRADVRNNKHLYFFQGGDPHPFLNDHFRGGLTYNDAFRAVHDFFGHAKNGLEFGPKGEEAAWGTHVQMFSPLAAKAMTTETRGQNSWVNFGPHNPEALPMPERPYATQKAAILPDEFTTTKADKVASIVRLKNGMILQSKEVPIMSGKMPTHLSILEEHNVPVSDVVDSGFKVGSNYQWDSGGGTIGRGTVTGLPEKKAASGQ